MQEEMSFFTSNMKLSFINMGLVALSIPLANAGESRERYIMGTLCEIQTDAPHRPAVTAAFNEIARLEQILSTYLPNSEVSQLNKASGTYTHTASPELWQLLSLSLQIAKESGGAFDPSFDSEPNARGYKKIRMLPRQRIRLPKGGRLNFGAIGKGFALDRAAAILHARGVKHAVLNFGGQILALGTPPRTETRIFHIAVPDGSRRPGPAISLSHGSLSTSGQYERPGHLRDPLNGTSIEHNGSITVIADSAAYADAWSTAFFIGGTEVLPQNFSGCIVTLNGQDAAYHGACAAYIPHTPVVLGETS